MVNRLKELREDNDLKQNDISNFLKISRQNYSRWELGEQIIPLKRLKEVSDFYKASLDYIMGLSKSNNYHEYKLNRKIIGENITKLRHKYNLSQKQLSEILNTTQSTICAYEKGKTLILTSFAYQICLKFNISLDYLCGYDENSIPLH